MPICPRTAFTNFNCKAEERGVIIRHILIIVIIMVSNRKNALSISRAENFSAWYQEVVTKANLAEYSRYLSENF
ncbi:MAG: hypothetical protein LBU35_01425 [Holosporales bacterium]|nr:hypothetical protein [Holosporales bacterium]